MMPIVMIRIKELKLNIRLKLFLINTPIIKIEKIDKVKNISGSKIFKLLSILIHTVCSNYKFVVINQIIY